MIFDEGGKYTDEFNELFDKLAESAQPIIDALNEWLEAHEATCLDVKLAFAELPQLFEMQGTNEWLHCVERKAFDG